MRKTKLTLWKNLFQVLMISLPQDKNKIEILSIIKSEIQLLVRKLRLKQKILELLQRRVLIKAKKTSKLWILKYHHAKISS